MREFYDLILVYGMAEFYDPVREYKLPADLGDKARFTGYVYRTRSVQSSKEVRSRLQVPEGQFVLATVGGGEDSYPVLQMIAGALHLSPISGFSTLITTGPMCPEGARQALMREEGEKVRVTEFVNDLPSAIAAADLVVSMGGYNSVCEILAFGRRAIVIPRTAPRREQLIRASVLASHGFVTLLNPNECTPVVLRETIEDTLANKAEPLLERRDMVKLDGAQRAANYLLDLAS